MSNATALLQKLWNYCHILQDDNLSYGHYIKQCRFENMTNHLQQEQI